MITIARAVPVNEGDSVKQKRIIPMGTLPYLDPFLRVDHFNLDQGGFPSQVHNGFEGLFYLYSGSILHEDSLANHFRIEQGGVELFSAGAGLLHSEMAEEKAHGVRIWIDLPSEFEFMDPSYQRYGPNDTPVSKNKIVEVRTVVGKGSPIKPKANIELLDVTMLGQSVYKYNIYKGFQGFLYVVEGSIKINGKPINTAETIYVKDEKDLAVLTHDGARLLICFGEPQRGGKKVQSSHTFS